MGGMEERDHFTWEGKGPFAEDSMPALSLGRTPAGKDNEGTMLTESVGHTGSRPYHEEQFREHS